MHFRGLKRSATIMLNKAEFIWFKKYSKTLQLWNIIAINFFFYFKL